MSSSLECIAGFLTDGPQYRGSCTTGYPAEIEGPGSIPGSGGPGCPGVIRGLGTPKKGVQKGAKNGPFCRGSGGPRFPVFGAFSAIRGGPRLGRARAPWPLDFGKIQGFLRVQKRPKNGPFLTPAAKSPGGVGGLRPLT